jgi:hypothetical protein
MKKCDYCSKEMDDNAVKCPHCGAWIPEINKVQTRFYYFVIGSIICGVFVVLRVVSVSKKFLGGSDYGRILSDPLAIILIIVFVILLIIVGIDENKLKKMKKGKLF